MRSRLGSRSLAMVVTSAVVDRDRVVRVIHLGQMPPDFIVQQALSLL